MAVISIKDGVVWGAAADVLRSVAKRLHESGCFPRLRKDFAAVEAGWQHLDLSDLDKTERDNLRRLVSQMISDVKKAGPDALADPEFFPAFLARLEELDQLVSGDRSE
jgi:hypothetical protein